MNTLTNFRRTIPLGAWLAAGAMCLAPVSSRGQGQSAPPTPQGASAAEQRPGVVIKKESKLVLVDSVVTDKKGNYIRDLTQHDFKVFENNKEQPVSTFSTGADAATQANGQRRYLILFFDNSTMPAPDQIQARRAATKCMASNAGPDRLMAAVDFGGSLRLVLSVTWHAVGSREPRAGAPAGGHRLGGPTPFQTTFPRGRLHRVHTFSSRPIRQWPCLIRSGRVAAVAQVEVAVEAVVARAEAEAREAGGAVAEAEGQAAGGGRAAVGRGARAGGGGR